MTDQAAKEQAADDLHRDIMNLPSKFARAWNAPNPTEWVQGYENGHRDALYAAAELVAARASSPVAIPEGWQPIETAPRGSGEDGPGDTRHPDYVEPPKVLLWTAEGIVVGYYDWYYHPGYGAGAEPGESVWRAHDGSCTYGVTHWMPLPQPPGASAPPSPGAAQACGHLKGDCEQCHQCLIDKGQKSCPTCEASPPAAQGMEPLTKIPGSDAVHMAHCYQGEYAHSCKYGAEDCPARASAFPPASPAPAREAQLEEALRKMLATHPYANNGLDGYTVLVTREQVEACREARAALSPSSPGAQTKGGV